MPPRPYPSHPSASTSSRGRPSSAAASTPSSCQDATIPAFVFSSTPAASASTSCTNRSCSIEAISHVHYERTNATIDEFEVDTNKRVEEATEVTECRADVKEGVKPLRATTGWSSDCLECQLGVPFISTFTSAVTLVQFPLHLVECLVSIHLELVERSINNVSDGGHESFVSSGVLPAAAEQPHLQHELDEVEVRQSRAEMRAEIKVLRATTG